jgi:hypothetical protein
MRKVAAALVFAGLCCVPVASAGSSSDALIRPGKSIGKAQLGMTEMQVRRALGRPLAVVRKRVGFGRSNVELQYADFNLFVELRTRRRTLRVVRVSTLQRSERTPQGIGIGSRRATLLARYGRRVVCAKPVVGEPFRGRVVVYGQTCAITGGGGRTVFELDGEVDTDAYWGDRQPYLSEWARYARVAEISVEAVG